MNDTSASLPKVGDVIPVEKFWVSETNMRYEVPFGESDGDQALINHFRRAGVVQPFKARPEKDGFGVVVGRRRFLAMREAGYEEFVVGKHVWVEELSDEEAIDASLKENLEEFHNAPDPVTRAEGINNYLSRLPTGIRGLARAWNMPHPTLIYYLKVLELGPEMREVVRKELIAYDDALSVVKLKLGGETEKSLAELVMSEGKSAFKAELARLMEGKGKRGIPKGVYFIDRIAWDKRYDPDVKLMEEIDKRAKERNMKRDEWIKWYLREYVKF